MSVVVSFVRCAYRYRADLFGRPGFDRGSKAPENFVDLGKVITQNKPDRQLSIVHRFVLGNDRFAVRRQMADALNFGEKNFFTISHG
jgi:hypothetical protein